MAVANHYDRLGVTPDASIEEIRRSWLKLAREHHPDFHTDASSELRAANEREMQSINESWAVLSDPERRRRYDEVLRSPISTSSNGVRQPTPGQYDFVPYDDGDDEIDPRLLDDVGVEGTEVSRSVQMLPIIFLFGGLIGVIGGVVINLMFLVAVGAVGLALAVFGFLAAPVVAITRSIQAERRS